MEGTEERVFEALEPRLDGHIIKQADPAFDDVRRVWNTRIDRIPSIIVQPVSISDVIQVVEVASEFGYRISVKGGGHHVGGPAVVDDAVMIDLARFDAISVDPTALTVTVGGGATWGQVDAATAPHGLAAVGGQDPNIGVAGLTLGGGVGWLSRAFGLAVDNLLEVELVTAAGEHISASPTEQEELFWGLRGAGGGLGIVTSFTFKVHPVETVLAGSLVYPLQEAHQAMRGYRTLVDDAPDTLRPLFGIFDLPPTSPLFDQVESSRVAIIIVCAIEPFGGSERVLESLRHETSPVVDSITTRPYVTFNAAGESEPFARTTLRSRYLETLDDQAIETIVGIGTTAPAAGATVFVSPRGGAEVEPPMEATAYAHREPGHHVLIEARWKDTTADEAHESWVAESAAKLAPMASQVGSINFVDADEPPTHAWFGPNRDRLNRLKQKWDPDDRFGGHAHPRWQE